MQSSSRNGAQVRLLAIHTTEGILKAADLRAWKAWPGSAHASADQYGTLLDGAADGFVDYSRASWTLRNGNAVSDNIELCGQAKWTRSDWMARPKLIELAAVWLARRKKARPHIPLVKLTPADVRAGKAGVIGHNDWTVGMKDGTHWDPGPGFPWDVVLARANQLASGVGSPITTLPAQPVQEDDMPAYPSWTQPERERLLTDIQTYVLQNPDVLNSIARAVWGFQTSGQAVQAQDRLTGIDMVVGATRSEVLRLGNGQQADPAALAAAIKDALGDDLAADVAGRLTVTPR